MNPAKRKKLYRAALGKETNKKQQSNVPVLEKKVEVTVTVPVELPKLGLQQIVKEEIVLPKEEIVLPKEEIPAVTLTEQPTVVSKKKKV